MLAEKFFLVLEMLISRTAAPTTTYRDGAPKVISQSQFVPIKLPDTLDVRPPDRAAFFTEISGTGCAGRGPP
jgi:hypothetical protein